MVGVPGIASAIFSTVRDANINVIMISQASLEQSICFAVAQVCLGRGGEGLRGKRGGVCWKGWGGEGQHSRTTSLAHLSWKGEGQETRVAGRGAGGGAGAPPEAVLAVGRQ